MQADSIQLELKHLDQVIHDFKHGQVIMQAEQVVQEQIKKIEQQ